MSDKLPEFQFVSDHIQADYPTANGRIYTRQALEGAVEKAQEMVAKGQMLGGLENSSDARMRLSDVSHSVSDLEIDDDGNIVGTIQILDTQQGRLLRELLKTGDYILDPRMTGDVDPKTGVVRGLKFSGANIIPRPAWMPRPSVVERLAALIVEDEDG